MGERHDLQLPDTFVAMLMQFLGSLVRSGPGARITPRDRDLAYVQVIEHIEAMLWHCQQQDHALGPQAVLTTVLAQRDLSCALLPECPDDLRPRMLSAQSEASRQAGWLSYDLKRFDHAGYYYEDARALAHQAQNIGLGAFVLCQMSQLATWQGTPTTCGCAPSPPMWPPGPTPPTDSETPA